MTKVAVVILNWNGATYLEKFLDNVLVHSRNDEEEVIVADNASTDNSLEWLQANHPEVRIIRNRNNGGFAKGYNDALKQVDAQYYVLLNSDVEVTANWIEPVIQLMDDQQDVAAVQPKILAYHDKESFEYAGAAGGFIDKYGYPFCRGRVFQHLEKDEGQYDDTREVFWATGACMFVRAKAYHELGGLDEDFFAHMEEIDFCWRLKQKGYRVMYTAESKVYHVGGGTLPKASSFKTYLNMRNNMVMLYKNLPRKKLLPTLFLKLVLDGIAAIKFLWDGGMQDLMAVVRAHLYYYKMLPHLRQKRKMLQPRDVNHIYRGSIVLDYYLRSKKRFKELSRKKFQ